MISIKIKVLAVLLAVIAGYGAVDFMFHRFVIFPSFLELEEDEAREDMRRVVQAFKREAAYIDSLCHDWSAWKDTYEFIVDSSEDYIARNLVLSSFSDNRLNLFYYIDLEGNVVWGEIRSLETLELLEVPEFPKDKFPPDHPLTRFDSSRKDLGSLSVSGIFRTSKGPMLIASRPILMGDNKGPIRGALAMGRFINNTTYEALQEQTRVKFKAGPVDNTELSAFRIDTAENRSDSDCVIEIKSENELSVRTCLKDIEGTPALAVEASIPRKISQRGASSLNYAVFSIVMTGAVVLLVTHLLLRKMVIGPLTRLKEAAKSIADDRQPSARMSMTRKDEIGELGRVFDRMVERLSETMVLLRESERMYRIITEHSLAHITIVQDGKFVYANPSALENIGYPSEELYGKPVLEVIHPEDRKMVEGKMKSREGEDASDHYQLRYVAKSGETRWLDLFAVPIPYRGNRATLGNAVDITHRKEAEEKQKRLEAQLQRARKMEAMGTMAGGVAHDLNNILGGIVSYPDLLLMNLPEDNPLRRPLSTIQQAGLRASDLVQDLLTMARRGVGVKDFVSLNGVVDQYLQSPEFERLKSAKSEMSVQLDLDERLLWIKGSPVHLYKSLMNLVQNSAEAMGIGGPLTISTENLHYDRTYRGFEQIEAGDYAVLTVADSGTGIASEDLEKIFEPFYTKKVMGISGTGLGMSVVWATVKDHNGFIDVVTRPGKGTTFKLHFPVTREIPPSGGGPCFDPNRCRGRGEKVLVIDDVESQREVAVEILKAFGYVPETVESGEKAIEYLRENTADILVLDMIMNSGMDGLDTYKEIIGFRPGQKAIIVSGYAETDRISETQRLGAGKFVKKPYTFEKLAVAIREELERSEIQASRRPE